MADILDGKGRKKSRQKREIPHPKDETLTHDFMERLRKREGLLGLAFEDADQHGGKDITDWEK